MVTREMIQGEVDRWSELPEDSRGELADYVRKYLEEEIAPGDRMINRGGETVDMVAYILDDLGSYDLG